MGNITGNSQIINHGPDDLFIGDNEFASEVLSLAAATTAKDGYILKRNSSNGKLELANDVDGQCFVLATRDDLVNTSGSAAMDFYVRVCITGKVKKSGVTVAGTALTAAQADALRASGILALDVTNIGKQDNQ
ncbi:hypothetical protein [uncultured Treponema sp.]|uniref:hypothetical protein n=1 Tax=uncultured Treponema sp. TaxID=162155 RepID=UPI002593BC70|nr:hypothetical protein [uncultured Treponema sp.]